MIDKKTIFIQAISSDIGYELALFWLLKGHKIKGTFRSESKKTHELQRLGVEIIHCDLQDIDSVNACGEWLKTKNLWDVTVIGAGTQDPIGMFEEVDFDEWESSIMQNFTGQLRLLHKILPARNTKAENAPVVLMFAGGGTNNATIRYSAYTISKIASIKMCELLDAEIPDTVFTILGPGWVNTKIHQSTLGNKDKAGENYQKTINMLKSDKCYPIDRVVSCCDWLINAERDLVGGRNFSAVHDPWDEKEIKKIKNNQNNFKLRRFGNNLFEG